jgi:hypothetical protein
VRRTREPRSANEREFNAELGRARVIEAGRPADEEPFVEPHLVPKQNR